MSNKKTIVLPAGATRITVSDALGAVHEAGLDGMLRVTRHADGSLAIRARDIRPVGELVKAQFLKFCAASKLEPSSPLDRWSPTYTGQGKQDDVYEITVDELRRFVEPFDIYVEVTDEVAKESEHRTGAIEVVNADSQPQTVPAAAAETPKQRRARLLAMFDAESAAGRERGVLARITKAEKRYRPTADRSNIGKDIKRAREERDAERRGLALPHLLG